MSSSPYQVTGTEDNLLCFMVVVWSLVEVLLLLLMMVVMLLLQVVAILW
jgi:hypothetical protein